MRLSGYVLQTQFAYHGWLIVAVVFLSSALSIGPGYAFGLFIEPLRDAFPTWQRTAISASLSFAAVGSLTSPLIGRLMDRYGARPVMIFSLAIMGTSFLLRPLMTELWHWYVLSFFQYVAFSGSAGLPAGRLVGVWFQRSRGRAMGLTTMGNNFGGLTVPLITGYLLASGNWQASFLLLAGLTYLIALLSLVIVREQPSPAAADPSNAISAPSAPALTGWTVHDALRSKSFYVLTLAMTLGSFTYSAVLPQVSDHLIAEGMSRTTVPLAISLLAAFGMMGKLGFGYLSERFSARRMMMASLGGQVVFVVLMVNFPTPPVAWLVVPMFGLFMGSYGTLVPLVTQEAFGLKHFGSISGMMALATVVPFFVGPLLAGASFDLTESYGTGFVIVAAMFAVAVVTLTQAGGPEPRPRMAG